MPMEHGRQASSGPRSPKPPTYTSLATVGPGAAAGGPRRRRRDFSPGHARSSAGQTTAGGTK
jgi:hypothetical protein